MKRRFTVIVFPYTCDISLSECWCNCTSRCQTPFSNRNLPAHSSGGRSLRPRCRQSCAPSEARREDSSSLLVMCWQPLASFGLQLGNSTLCLHHPPALSRSVSSQGHLLIRTPVILDWHPTPVLLPGKSHGWRSLAIPLMWELLKRRQRLH